MSTLQIFNFANKQVRTQVDELGNPWWVAKDVCDILGIVKHRDAVARLDDDESMALRVDALEDVTCISESGLYSLILRSQKPEAKKFKKWITSEVLPSIRKTGAYFSKSLTIDERLALALAAEVDTRKQISEIKTDLTEVRHLAIQASSHNSANTGFMTIRGYCNIHGIQLSLKQSQAVGKACAALTKCLGAETRKTDDEMFGRVNSYPLGVLEEVFKDVRPGLAS